MNNHNNNISRLELLPNEIFTEIFQYFDIKEIFQMFDNLNGRFNKLIRSLNNLIFNFYDKNNTTTYNFTNYIDILSIHCHVNINFKHFKNIRHLNLIYIPDQFLGQLNMDILPYLQSLSVTHIERDLVYVLYEKIFSNKFPCLKYGYISQKNEIQTNIMFKHLPVLCNLQIGLIDLRVYATILSICPSLNLFKFRLKSDKISVNIVPHVNLKRMIIKPDDYIQSNNVYAIEICLSFVTNLQRLSIDEIFFQLNIQYYLKCDWHASFINRYLPLLRHFNYYLRVWHVTKKDHRIVNTLDQLKNNFQYSHNDPYKSRFHLKYIY